jgi:putative ABC transport system permease protein
MGRRSRGALSLLRYAASGILRNRRRTFSSILGVLLAVTFIAGTFIAIDSSTRFTLDAILANTPGDFSLNAWATGSGSGIDLRELLASVPGVTNASVFRSLPTFPISGANNFSGFGYQFYAVDPTHLPVMFQPTKILGTQSPTRGNVTLSTALADQLGVRLGNRIQMVKEEFNFNGTTRNWTLDLTVAGIVTLAPTANPYYLGPYSGTVPPVAEVNLADATWALSQLNITDMMPYFSGEIWIDRGQYVNPYDVPATTFALTRLGRQLDRAIASTGAYSGSVSDNISYLLQNFGFTLLIQRLQFFILSSPVILLGLYLGAVGVDLGHAERRRELGVLKTRGASRRQIVGVLILESLLSGLLAALIGLAAGIGLSRFLLGVVTPLGSSTPVSYTDLFLSPETIVSVAVLSIVFMAVVSYRSAKRTSSLPIVETLRYYAPGETRLQYSPTTDLFLIGYSVTAYLVTWFSRGLQGNFVLTMLAFVLILSLPLVPILLIVGSTRLATRSTGRVYEWTTRATRPFTKDLENVVRHNLSRNPRRSSNIAIIIALGLAFGVFVVSFLGSQQALLQRQAWATVGGDFSVGPARSFNGTVDPGFARNLSLVPGVARISPVVSVVTDFLYSSASVVALDPSTYFDVAQPEPFYFLSPGEDQAKTVLGTNGSVLITQAYQVSAALQIGDRLSLTSTIYNGTGSTTARVNVTVGGIVRYLPGTSGAGYGFYTAPSMIYGSNRTLGALTAAASTPGGPVYFGGNDRYLVQLSPGANWTEVKTAILALGTSDVIAYQDYLNSTANGPFTASLLGFVKLEVAFIVVILTAGLGLIIYAASLERDVEFAGITARGSSGWQTAGLLVGEAFSIMVIGLVVGTTIGLVSSYLFTVVTTPTGAVGVEPVIPAFFVFPVEGVLLLVLAPVAMLGMALLVSWRIAKMNVAQVLKMRGG